MWWQGQEVQGRGGRVPGMGPRVGLGLEVWGCCPQSARSSVDGAEALTGSVCSPCGARGEHRTGTRPPETVTSRGGVEKIHRRDVRL